MRLARALAGSSHQLGSLSSEAHNCTQQSMESFERESGEEVELGSYKSKL